MDVETALGLESHVPQRAHVTTRYADAAAAARASAHRGGNSGGGAAMPRGRSRSAQGHGGVGGMSGAGAARAYGPVKARKPHREMLRQMALGDDGGGNPRRRQEKLEMEREKKEKKSDRRKKKAKLDVKKVRRPGDHAEACEPHSWELVENLLGEPACELCAFKHSSVGASASAHRRGLGQ